MFAIFIFCAFSKQLLKHSHDFISEPIISIPVTIIYIGNHPIIEPNIINSEFTKQWYQSLSHSSSQKIRNQTNLYVSSDIIKVPPLKYRFDFSLFNLTEEDNHVFEEAFSSFSRPSKWKKGHKVIHPYSLQLLFNSLVDYYDIKNYTFFIYATERTNYQYCEGLDQSEYQTSPDSNFSIPQLKKFDKSLPWGQQVKKLLSHSENSLGDWSTPESVYNNIFSNPFLKEELIHPATSDQCSQYWTMDKRIFFSDASQFARMTIHEDSADDSPTLSEKLADAINSFEKICKNANNPIKQSNLNYCPSLESYISHLQAQVKALGESKSSQVLQRFLSNSSAIILDALKLNIIPTIPSFDAQLPEVFKITISTIGKPPGSFNLTKITEIYNSYMIGEASTNFVFEQAQLIEWPLIALPLYNATIGIQTSSSSSSSSGSSSGDRLGSVNSELLRESLQFKTVNHRVYSDNQSIQTRDLLAFIAFHWDSQILINGNSDFFAFDNVAFALGNTNDDFHPHGILRSSLTHMYGISPMKRWRSLSIMCTQSHHTNLNVISRDCAYRNSIWIELSKTNVKVKKHFNRAMKILKFSQERSNNSISIDEDVLYVEAKEVANQLEETLNFASNFMFDEMLASVKLLRAKRKVLTKHLKAIVNDLEFQMCAFAPKNLIVKNPSFFDRFDTFATITFPMWIGLLVISFLTAMYAFTKRMKMN
ncbi:hypothetical protein TRFO_07281 [Tritrichomonas foetus]|uniref:Uncharacterized protein n=1 Tax=Tritrichomonas foetus TaxID=1144522 RepID=A0A1J4JXU8_9EUKA|nr:hypothetical protein TRFO_07281 [Tritrichomonas foetus]|eukprot:OHT02093.1 hypothetical protein TRFO_07281 [Tritrichomonas foetus]